MLPVGGQPHKFGKQPLLYLARISKFPKIFAPGGAGGVEYLFRGGYHGCVFRKRIQRLQEFPPGILTVFPQNRFGVGQQRFAVLPERGQVSGSGALNGQRHQPFKPVGFERFIFPQFTVNRIADLPQRGQALRQIPYGRVQRHPLGIDKCPRGSGGRFVDGQIFHGAPVEQFRHRWIAFRTQGFPG